MQERTVYVDGIFVPESKASISVFDRGVQWGDSVYDAARTYNRRPFKVREHIERLYSSCLYTRMPLPLSIDEMEKITNEVVERNMPLVASDHDDMIWWSVTRGVNPPSRSVLDCKRANVIVSTFPVPFFNFAKPMMVGAKVVTPSIRRTPSQCVDAKAKISGKMNHILADLEAKGSDPEAYSLMLDINGNISENSSGNIFWVKGGQLFTPTSRNILVGVSRTTIFELASRLNVEVVEGDFTLLDLYTADEAFLSSTPYGILPIATLNGAEIGRETPGPTTKSLTESWSRLVGIDIVSQAQKCSAPATPVLSP
ncbi:aminotransferase class IV [Pseudorhodoplanes sp.]|uniref:aminotransferase class IV n=1 Tax=Pseudorhodoplanes sp. TaxID=1934341 RepID=UPI003D10C382